MPAAAPDPYSATANRTFRAALVAYWQATPALVAISPAPYADRAPPGLPDGASYCLLSEISSRGSERGTRGRAFRQDVLYQFAVYHREQAEAIARGLTMTAWLDKIQDNPLQFAEGYQRAWWWQAERLLLVPEV